MIVTAIVEDDMRTARQLSEYLMRYGEENGLIFQPRRYTRAEDLINHFPEDTDLILMDINLDGMNGMAAARELRATGYDTPLIFITCLSQYAVHGYEVDALDFMIKPVSYYPFSMKIKKAVRVLKRRTGLLISISVNRSPCVFPSDDLYYVETARHDLIYHTIRNSYRVRGSMADAEKRLSSCGFLRINTCYLINLKYLTGFSQTSVTIANGDELTVSRPRRKDVQTSIVRYLGESV